MILKKSLKIKNFKCFASNPEGFDNIFPINIIIGKNNSGKSSLIDLVEYATNPQDSFLRPGRDGMPTEVIVGDTITDTHIEGIFPKDTSGGGIPGTSHYEYGMTLLGQKVHYLLQSNKSYISWENRPISEAFNYTQRMREKFQLLEGKRFLRIMAERDLKVEGANYSEVKISSDGSGATNLLRTVVNNANLNHNLVRINLLQGLNEIMGPEHKYIGIAPKEVNNIWEIYLEDDSYLLLPLSKMGSGIKTVILVLINLLVFPEFISVQKKDLVFGFEELENNLHPSLQRKLFKYLLRYSNENGSIFFITTHSNVVIDLFSASSFSQIVHIQNHGGCSTTKTVFNGADNRNILRDLDFKASDLLMSNGVVWVEGPSDVIYIELLLELYRNEKSIPGKAVNNYTVQTLAPSVWKYAGFTEFSWGKVDEDLCNNIISLHNLNSNHLLIIDNDGNYDDKAPSNWNDFRHGAGRNKARLIFESLRNSGYLESDLTNNFGETKDGKLFFWVNNGTIETYLEHLILNKGKDRFEKYFEGNDVGSFFKKRKIGENSSISKVSLASEISKFCWEAGIKFEDIAPAGSNIRDKIERLDKTIESWN